VHTRTHTHTQAPAHDQAANFINVFDTLAYTGNSSGLLHKWHDNTQGERRGVGGKNEKLEALAEGEDQEAEWGGGDKIDRYADTQPTGSHGRHT